MSMTRESLFDSNTQLISLGITRSSHALVSLSKILPVPSWMITFTLQRAETEVITETHDFMVMKYNRLDLPTYHPIGYWDDQDANLDIIKFCGFGKCPNRYAYISRPQVVKDLFSTDKTVFLFTDKKGQLTINSLVMN